ncbi:hypothetical protein BLOT_015434 [Blomia tropicalis]|nr:hypothetical protein BLOT_015434 [Blomia tropicalis]
MNNTPPSELRGLSSPFEKKLCRRCLSDAFFGLASKSLVLSTSCVISSNDDRIWLQLNSRLNGNVMPSTITHCFALSARNFSSSGTGRSGGHRARLRLSLVDNGVTPSVLLPRINLLIIPNVVSFNEIELRRETDSGPLLPHVKKSLINSWLIDFLRSAEPVAAAPAAAAAAAVVVVVVVVLLSNTDN